MISLTTLKERIRSRAQNWYGLDLTVKSKGNTLTLTLRHKETGQTATENVSVAPSDLNDLYYDNQALTEYADRIIERFVFPVRPLQLLDDD
jgi:hypothetical protein